MPGGSGHLLWDRGALRWRSRETQALLEGVSRNCLPQLQMQPQSELDPTPQPATGRALEVLLSARGVREAFKQRSEMRLFRNV